MDELKNLVIQTLEANGILGQIRAKLRSSVFKVIDNNDPSGKERALHWENPFAQKVLETTESALAADLIREYMEFYKLDYSLSIFIPEANLKQDPVDRKSLVERSEVDKPSDKEPLLVQLLKQKKSSAGPLSRGDLSKQEEPKIDTVESWGPSSGANTRKGLEKKDVSSTKTNQKDNKGSKYTNKQSNFDDYDDDFEDDDIEELLPEDDNKGDEDDNKIFTESGNAFTGSQSMGMDPSVNTLAMDEYDHVEEVVRIS